MTTEPLRQVAWDADELESDDDGERERPLLDSPKIVGRFHSPAIDSEGGSLGDVEGLRLRPGEDRALERENDVRGSRRLALISFGSACCGSGWNAARGGMGKVITGPSVICRKYVWK